MKRFAQYFLVALTLLSPLAGGAFGRIRVHAQVDSSTDIYPGDRFVYSIVIEGADKAGQVDLAPIAKHNPQYSSTQIVNRTVCMMNYSIMAVKPGKIRLDPVTVAVNGRKYKTNAVELTVSTPGTTDKLKLKFSLSEDTCYVGQPVLMTVDWYIMAKFRGGAFNVPVFESDDFYFEDTPEVEKAPAQQKYEFHNVPVLLTQKSELIKGVRAKVISFTKVLIPKRAGRLVLEPLSASTELAVGRVRTRSLFTRYVMKYKKFAVSSKPVELNVLPLPQEGKPPEFYGLVGRYAIFASATPTKVNVGDPITLTIKIGGGRYLKPIGWPAFEKIPLMAANFKIPSQRSSPKIENGLKVFTQTIRANNDQVTAIPAIPLAFFDPDSGKYTVAKTEPIKLDVAPTVILTGNDLEGRDFTRVNKEVEAIKKGLSANYEGFDILINQSFSPATAVLSPGYATVWALPLGAFVFSALIKLFTRTDPKKNAVRRRRSACGKATRQLKSVGSAGADERHELVVSAMKQYIGDRFDRMAGSLTADDCHEVILAATGDSETGEAYRQIITECQAARYASAETNSDTAQIKSVVLLIRDIEKKSKKR